MAKKIQTPQLNPNMRQYKVGDGILTTPQFNGARARLGATQSTPLTYEEQLALEKDQADANLNTALLQQQQAIDNFNKAAEQRHSTYQAAVEMMNPKKQGKYSEENVNREKRRAIATSLGNLFSAIAGGAMAGAGVGMGYVPQAAPNKSLAKLSQLEADYLKAGEDYQGTLDKLKMKKADDDVKVAQQNVANKVQAVEDAKKAIANVDKKIDGMRAYQHKSDIVEARQKRVANNAAANSATATAQKHSNAMVKQHDSQAFTAEENEKNRTHRSEENEKNRAAQGGGKPSSNRTPSVAERSTDKKDKGKDAARKRINL